jgi:hypothetical protein
MAIQTVFFGGCFSQIIYTLVSIMAMQTAAPHNVESDAIQLSDEYRAMGVPLSFVHSSSPFFLSVHNQQLMLSTYSGQLR